MKIVFMYVHLFIIQSQDQKLENLSLKRRPTCYGQMSLRKVNGTVIRWKISFSKKRNRLLGLLSILRFIFKILDRCHFTLSVVFKTYI